MSDFDAAGWIGRFMAAGGKVARQGDALHFVIRDLVGDALSGFMAELGAPEWQRPERMRAVFDAAPSR